MPLYQYRCAAGHTFEAQGKMDGSDAPASCTVAVAPKLTVTPADGQFFDAVQCGVPVQKLISAPAGSFPGADSWRK